MLEGFDPGLLVKRRIHDFAFRKINLAVDLLFGNRQDSREVIVFEDLDNIKNAQLR